MNSETIQLGKQYRQSIAAIERFVSLHKQIIDSTADKVTIDVSDTTYIADGLLVLLAVLPSFSRIYDKQITIRYNRGNRKMYQVLKDSGILNYYLPNEDVQAADGCIQFCNSTEDEEFMNLVRQIMKLAPVSFNIISYATMYSKLAEIFINAKTHGENELGTYTYGNLHKDEFVFTIYDAGIGIKAKVNDYLNKELSSRETMEWALVGGHSTLKCDYPRGAGFTILEEFVYKNNGKLTLCSDDVICIMKERQRHFYSMKTSIKGTLFIMNIKMDNQLYDINKVR